MPLDFSAVVTQVRQTLTVTDPDLDTSVGTTTRKMIDAFAESVAEGYVDQHMLSYIYDIDSKQGADLDTFVAVFGMNRLAATRATGVVVFSRASVGSQDQVTIPVGTQIGSNSTPSIIVATVVPAVLEVGMTSVAVPVQAVNAGPDGNVGAGLLIIIQSPVTSVPVVTNLQGLAGGAAQESDTDLRQRWKDTVFRNLAGTEQMFLGIALADPDCTAANVIGSSKHYREQVQIEGGAATSTLAGASYVWPASSTLGANIDSGVILLRDYDYTFQNSVPPSVTISAPQYDTGEIDPEGDPVVAAVDGAILDLDFEYVPSASRNDPNNGITNRIDVWVSGVRAQSAIQTVVFQTTLRFTSGTYDPFNTAKFVREDGTHPQAGNVFIPLAFGPILTVPLLLSIGGTTYPGDGPTPAYRIVHRDDAYGYGQSSQYGLEWDQTRLPPGNTVFTVGDGYTYNELPSDVQTAINKWRLTSFDAQAHAAKMIYLRFNLAIMYASGANQTNVNGAIDIALSSLLSRVGFGATLQVSDVIQAVHNVAGVDNVRLLTSADDPVNYAIQRSVNGNITQIFAANGRAVDVTFGDDQIPTFDSAIKIVKAQNTFNVGA